MISVSIERTALSLAALTITDYPPLAGFWLPEDGLGRPAKTWQRKAVSSPFTHGEVVTSAVLEQASIPLTIYARAATTADLRALQDDLEDALSQWSFDVTLTEDGQARTFACDPADVSWGAADAGMTRAHMAKATVTIPCYPVGA